MYGFAKACSGMFRGAGLLLLLANIRNSRPDIFRSRSGRIQDVAGLARVQLPADVAKRLVRHFNAAQVSGYVGLNAIGHGSPYSKKFFFNHYNQKHQLLTTEEMRMLDHHDMDKGGLFMKEMVTWCRKSKAV